MIYLLDSNTIIESLHGNATVEARLQQLRSSDFVLCAPVLAELIFGLKLSERREENRRKLAKIIEEMRFQPFEESSARRFGELKASLRQRGVTLQDFDLAIAAIALELNYILVSGDQAFHKNKIEGLALEDWTQPPS